MTADFNYYLNTQGVRGRKGEKGDTGFAPIITVGQNTFNTFTLLITTETGTFETPNLRGSVVSTTGSGTILAYNRETDVIYLTDIPTANTTDNGLVRLATEGEVSSGVGDGVITASDLGDFAQQNLFNYLNAGDGIALNLNSETGVITISLVPSFIQNLLLNGTGITLTKNQNGTVQFNIDNTYLPTHILDGNGIQSIDSFDYGTTRIGIRNDFVPNSLIQGDNITLTKNTSNGTVKFDVTIPDCDVTSVNGQTGDVVLDASDVGALPDSTVIPTVGDGTITFTQGGVLKGTITTNQSGNSTIDFDAGGSGGGAVEDVQVNGTSVLDTTTGIANITGLATDASVVHLSGQEQITGVKTFQNTTLRSNFLTDLLGTPFLYHDQSTNSVTIGDGGTFTINGTSAHPVYFNTHSETSQNIALVSDISSALTPYVLSSTLATVATTGAYSDLTGTPAINNATITINQGGVQKGTFTLNQSSNTTIDLDAGGGSGSAIEVYYE